VLPGNEVSRLKALKVRVWAHVETGGKDWGRQGNLETGD